MKAYIYRIDNPKGNNAYVQVVRSVKRDNNWTQEVRSLTVKKDELSKFLKENKITFPFIVDVKFIKGKGVELVKVNE